MSVERIGSKPWTVTLTVFYYCTCHIVHITLHTPRACRGLPGRSRGDHKASTLHWPVSLSPPASRPLTSSPSGRLVPRARLHQAACAGQPPWTSEHPSCHKQSRHNAYHYYASYILYILVYRWTQLLNTCATIDLRILHAGRSKGREGSCQGKIKEGWWF